MVLAPTRSTQKCLQHLPYDRESHPMNVFTKNLNIYKPVIGQLRLHRMTMGTVQPVNRMRIAALSKVNVFRIEADEPRNGRCTVVMERHPMVIGWSLRVAV